MAVEVEPVKIKVGPDDRYIVVVHGLTGGQAALAEAGERLRDQFNEWWEGGRKFAVFTVAEGVTVEVERMEADGKD